MKSNSGYRVLQPGETFTLDAVPAGTSLGFTPTPGATVTGQYSLSGVGNFVPCEFGSITQQFNTTIDGACYLLKFTCSGAPATVEWSA